MGINEALKYCASIRNSRKSEYAHQYLNTLLSNRDNPDFDEDYQDLSYLAKQAVRMRLDTILDRPTDMELA